MILKVKIAFKNSLTENVEFEVALPKDAEDKGDEDVRRKAFDKVTRMVMTMGKGKGFINTHGFGFRVEDVSFLKLLDK